MAGGKAAMSTDARLEYQAQSRIELCAACAEGRLVRG
jgi:hypothetical protein